MTYILAAIIIPYFIKMWQLAIEGQLQGIWFYGALYIFLVCQYSLIFQIRTRSWPYVYGKLAGLSVKKFGPTDPVLSEQEYTSKALYRYKVSGAEYEGTRVSPWVFITSHNIRFILEKQMSSVQKLPDGRVKVFYNPNKPSKSYLIVSGRLGITITLLISFIPFVLFFWRY